MLLAGASAAQAQPARPDPTPPPADIVVYGRAPAQIGVAISGSQGTVGYRNFETRPLSRVGELVKNVPDVIAMQHSGTGKAHQYFLRGFNLDHGTDFARFVDSVPVDMLTHGHGQGYMDLNVLIPEFVGRTDYRNGPYFADVGDFSAAGTVKFTTLDTLAAPIAQVTIGSFGYDSRARGRAAAPCRRGVARGAGRHAVERAVGARRAAAQGEPPARIIARHRRFGLEHRPFRLSRGVEHHRSGAAARGLTAKGTFGATQVDLFAAHDRLRLISNFTHFLDDPVHDAEFEQRDRRGVFGASIRHDIRHFPRDVRSRVVIGCGISGELLLLGAPRTAGTASVARCGPTALLS